MLQDLKKLEEKSAAALQKALQSVAQANGGPSATNSESSMLAGPAVGRSIEIYNKVIEKYKSTLEKKGVNRILSDLALYIVEEKLGNDRRFLNSKHFRKATPEDFTNGKLNLKGKYKAALRALLDERKTDRENGIYFGRVFHPGSSRPIGPVFSVAPIIPEGSPHI